MTPTASDPIAVGQHVIHRERRATGHRYYRCEDCDKTGKRPAKFYHLTCGEPDA